MFDVAEINTRAVGYDWRAVSATECTSQQFQCRRSRLCIDLRYKCDQRNDCDDASDEADCGRTRLTAISRGFMSK